MPSLGDEAGKDEWLYVQGRSFPMREIPLDFPDPCHTACGE